MQLIDEILEYLQYHPLSSRKDVEGCLSGKASSATVYHAWEFEKKIQDVEKQGQSSRRISFDAPRRIAPDEPRRIKCVGILLHRA